MNRLISETTHTARKDHECMACLWLVNCVDDTEELTFAEKRAVVRARRNKWKIKKGQTYIKQTLVDDTVYSVKLIPEIHEICIRLELYDD